jgi:integrase
MVVVLHKRGEPHPVSLNAKGLAAAERLQARGNIPGKRSIHRVLDACVKNEDFNLAELRHSFATWADKFGREVKPPERAGVTRDLIKRVMGHKNDKTTAGHYIDTDVPPMIALPLNLENPEDPSPLRLVSQAGAS